MTYRLDALVGILASLAMALSSMVVAIAEQSESIWPVVEGLAKGGIFAGFCAYLLWRGRERDREHTEERRELSAQYELQAEKHSVERREAWKAFSALRDSLERSNETLVRIETVLRERK